jgi:hypothetical protein
MLCSNSTLHSPASAAAAATPIGSAAGIAATAAAATVAAAGLSSDAAELLFGAAAVRRSNDELLLAESVVSSSDSDSDSDDHAVAGRTQRNSRRIRHSMQWGSIGNQGGGWDGRSSTCSSLATASSGSSRENMRRQKDMTSRDTCSTLQTHIGPQIQCGGPAAAAVAVMAATCRTSSDGSWRDSWDDDIELFCSRLQQPQGNAASQQPHHEQQVDGVADAAAAAAAAAAAYSAVVPGRLALERQQQQHQAFASVGSSNQVPASSREPAAAAAGHASPGCNRCQQLEAQLQELQFQAELAAAQAAAVAEERDLVLLQQQSLLDLIAQQQIQ